MPINEIGTVVSAPRGLTRGEFSEGSIDPSGTLVIIDFYMKAMLDGRGFQVRAGTISVPLTGDGTAITDTAAERCADAVAGQVIIPVYCLTSIDTWTADDSEGASKSVATVSSSGTAFVPLPMLSTGPTRSVAASTTARVQATGAVTVTAELATTTLRHYSWHSDEGGTPATDITSQSEKEWQPLRPPILVGPRCFYVQVSLATYMAHFDYLEFTTGHLGLAS